MDRHHLRHDKTCLNCGDSVQERYCSHCGQENIEPKESFRHLIGHFLADVTHYDSKLFITIKDLIFRPGFLTKEYNAGKRMGYLNPIRMYIFISAVFFLVMFSQKTEENTAEKTTTAKQDVNYFRQHLADSLRGIFKTTGKLSSKDSIRKGLYISLASRLDTASKTTESADQSVTATINNYGVITFRLKENSYASVAEYDSAQLKLADSACNGTFIRYITRKSIRLMHAKGSTGEIVITRDIEHDIPKIMFVLLPLFALFVGFFYSRKKYLYTQHAIFSIHFHSFMFVFLLLMGLVELALPMDKMWLDMIGISLLGIFIYLVIALYKVYVQAFWLSVIKGLAISILYGITLLICICVLIAGTFVFL